VAPPDEDEPEVLTEWSAQSAQGTGPGEQ